MNKKDPNYSKLNHNTIISSHLVVLHTRQGIHTRSDKLHFNKNGNHNLQYNQLINDGKFKN